MKGLAVLLVALVAAMPAAAQGRYLVSIVDLPLDKDESLIGFSFETWGVQVERVCALPRGWRIMAGTDATPDGVIAGSGSHGATWFRERSPEPLDRFVLVTLSGPVQREEKDSAPATFKGEARISTEADERTAPLTAMNVRLTRAKGCPN